MTLCPADLPAISAPAAILLNALAARLEPLQLSFGARSATVHATLTTVDGPLRSIGLRTRVGVLGLAYPSDLVTELAQAVLPGSAHWQTPPPGWLDIVVFGRLADALEPLLGPITLDPSRRGPVGCDGARLTVMIDGSRYPVTCDAPGTLLAALGRLAAWSDQSPDGAAITFPTSLRWGGIVLTTQELRAAEPGDILFVHAGSGAPPPPFLLIERVGTACGRLEDAFFITETFMPSTSPLADHESWEDEDEDAVPQRALAEDQDPDEEEDGWSGDSDDMFLTEADLDALPITLDFQIASLSIPLQDLARLGPGSAVPCMADFSQPVTILANGTRIGRGLLHRVGDRIGVRITQWPKRGV